MQSETIAKLVEAAKAAKAASDPANGRTVRLSIEQDGVRIDGQHTTELCDYRAVTIVSWLEIEKAQFNAAEKAIVQIDNALDKRVADLAGGEAA